MISVGFVFTKIILGKQHISGKYNIFFAKKFDVCQNDFCKNKTTKVIKIKFTNSQFSVLNISKAPKEMWYLP